MIDEWLNKFGTAWVEKDIVAVMNLFEENVEYWETPFVKFETKSELKKEWMTINGQSNIKLHTQLVVSDREMNTVKWRLEYKNEKSESQHVWSGLYLITINQHGLCTYFYQVGEKQ